MSGEAHSQQRQRLLWIAFAAPAIGWVIQLTASFTIAAYACASGRMWILHTISAGALLLAVVGMAGAWRVRRLQRERGEETGTKRDFLVTGALLLAALFFLTIVAGEVSNWLLEPCV